MVGLSLIGYETGYYLRAVKCADCDKRILVGRTVWGILRNGRSLSHRICNECHDEREYKALMRRR